MFLFTLKILHKFEYSNCTLQVIVKARNKSSVRLPADFFFYFDPSYLLSGCFSYILLFLFFLFKFIRSGEVWACGPGNRSRTGVFRRHLSYNRCFIVSYGRLPIVDCGREHPDHISFNQLRVPLPSRSDFIFFLNPFPIPFAAWKDSFFLVLPSCGGASALLFMPVYLYFFFHRVFWKFSWKSSERSVGVNAKKK